MWIHLYILLTNSMNINNKKGLAIKINVLLIYCFQLSNKIALGTIKKTLWNIYACCVLLSSIAFFAMNIIRADPPYTQNTQAA